MESILVLKTVEAFVRKELQDAEGGHDWWHTQRVREMALHLGRIEQANLFITELAALFHDISDAKFNKGDEDESSRKAREFLQSLSVREETISAVEFIIRNISFRSEGISDAVKSIEFKVVQDADRLDALGAIGIARAFNYGGYRNRLIYNPEIPPDLNLSKKAYKTSQSPTINHFYEKLLLLKDLMNTAEAKKIANHRHKFVMNFLKEFYAEMNR